MRITSPTRAVARRRGWQSHLGAQASMSGALTCLLQAMTVMAAALKRGHPGDVMTRTCPLAAHSAAGDEMQETLVCR